MSKKENGVLQILRVRGCREVEKPAHGERLCYEMNAHHLAQNLLEMMRGLAFLEKHQGRVFEG